MYYCPHRCQGNSCEAKIAFVWEQQQEQQQGHLKNRISEDTDHFSTPILNTYVRMYEKRCTEHGVPLPIASQDALTLTPGRGIFNTNSSTNFNSNKGNHLCHLSPSKFVFSYSSTI